MEQILLRPEEAAEALGLNRSSVFEAIRRGELESVKVGRLRRIPADAVVAFVDRLRQPVEAA